MNKDFAKILYRIRTKQPYHTDDLIPYICQETIEARREANAALAEAFVEAGDFKRARVFAERAWLFSGFDVALLPLYEKIVVHQGDLDALREAYKRAGMKASRSEGVGAALPLFYKSMYAYAFNGKGDSYAYDFDIFQELERLAEPFRFNTSKPTVKNGERKIRVAYLVFGATHPNSVIVKILKSIAQHHNREAFDIAFFVPENELSCNFDCAVFQSNLLNLSCVGTPVYVTYGRNLTEQLFSTAKQIYDYQADILVTSALLADLKQYFIAALHPAAITIGLTSGPPQQFSAPLLDWSISWDPHALIDCTSDCSQVMLQIDAPSTSNNRNLRRQHQIADDSIVLLTAGRPSKFDDKSYWESIISVLRIRQNVTFVVIGVGKLPDFTNEILTTSLRNQIKTFGWTDNYIELVQMADVVVDTYPSGGGVTLMDAMALGIPTITFKNDSMQLFNQMNWSPGQWIIDIPELIVDRYSKASLSKLLIKIIDNSEFRAEVGKACKDKFTSKRDSPTKMVADIENVYLKLNQIRVQKENTTLMPIAEQIYNNDISNTKINFEKLNRHDYEQYIFNKPEVSFAISIYNNAYLLPIIKHMLFVISCLRIIKSRFLKLW